MTAINNLNNLNIIHKNEITPIYKAQDLKVLYLNIRSIRHKLHDLESLIQSFQIPPDIILLTEIWIREEENSKFNIQNYKSFFANRKTTQAGGVCIFIRKDLTCNEILNLDEEETSWLGINLLKLNINLFVIYRSPSANSTHFLQYFEELLSKTSKNLIIGDINFDLLQPNNTSIKYKEVIEGHGHILLNKLNKNHATRVTENTRTILDHIITDCFSFTYQITLSDVSLSDHKQISINIATNTPLNRKPQEFEKQVINYERIKNQKLIESLNNITTLDNFIPELEKIINQNTTRIKLNNSYKKRKIWMTTPIIKAIRKRDKLYKIKSTNPHNSDVVILFKKIKNRIKYQIEVEKKITTKPFS